MYLFEANLNLLANKSTHGVAQYSNTLNETSLPTVFVVGPLVLPREEYSCNTTPVRRCKPKNAWSQVCIFFSYTMDLHKDNN